MKKVANKKVQNISMDLEKMAETSPGLKKILSETGAKPKKDKSEFVRVQLDFPLKRIEELTEVMREVEIETRKDLFNNALSLFVWAVGEKAKGNRLFSVNDEEASQKELVMMPLENAATKARRRLNPKGGRSTAGPPNENEDGFDGETETDE